MPATTLFKNWANFGDSISAVPKIHLHFVNENVAIGIISTEKQLVIITTIMTPIIAVNSGLENGFEKT